MRNVKFIFRGYYFFFVMSTGVVLPYLNLYFKKIGLNGKQIGTLTSLGMLCMFFAPPLWSMVNDRYNKHGRLIGFLIVACVASFFAVSFSNTFYFLIPVVLLFYFFYSPLIPLSDAVTLEYVNHTEIDNYGKVRLWGTIGFVIASIVFGWLINAGDAAAAATGSSNGLIAAAGMKPIFYGFIVVMVGALLFSRLLPKEHVRSKSPDLRNIGQLFANKNFVDVIGVKWLIVAGMIASCLRWFLCSITYNPYYALPIQMLHSVTFAAFYVGAITFVFKESPPNFRATGQFAYRSVSRGLGPIIGMLIGGYMLDTVGIFTMYKMTSGVIFLTVLLMVVFLKEPAEQPADKA